MIFFTIDASAFLTLSRHATHNPQLFGHVENSLYSSSCDFKVSLTQNPECQKTHVNSSHIFPHVTECHSVILSQFYSHFHNIIVSNTLQIFVSVELRRMTMIRYKG